MAMASTPEARSRSERASVRSLSPTITGMKVEGDIQSHVFARAPKSQVALPPRGNHIDAVKTDHMTNADLLEVTGGHRAHGGGINDHMADAALRRGRRGTRRHGNIMLLRPIGDVGSNESRDAIRR